LSGVLYGVTPSDVATFAEMNKAYVPNFPTNPPARATVIVGLPGPTYKVEVTMTAVKGPKQAITTPGPDGAPGKPNPNLSSAIKVGNRLYVSGILGNNATNKGDAEAQTRETMARIERTLKAAGFEWTDVVDGVVYITNVANFQAMNNAYRPVIGKDFPARATVVTGLVGQEDQRGVRLLEHLPPLFAEPEDLGVEADAPLQVLHPHHRMEKSWLHVTAFFRQSIFLPIRLLEACPMRYPWPAGAFAATAGRRRPQPRPRPPPAD
jgi:enamine deaminase RidA (YjgF/YER057c/UK114 family)